MTARNLKSINAYTEFRTDAGIDIVRAAVAAGNPPAGLTPARSARFTARYLNNDWVVSNLPALVPPGSHGLNRLRYRPQLANGTPPIDLVVAYSDERTPFMTAVWNDRRRGYGVGLQAFYYQVATSYLNIQKIYTDDFLTGKGDYQIQKTPQRKVIAPIVTQHPNERWGMDLIDMGIGPITQRIRRYILTVVDFFSGYVWARHIQVNDGATIQAALNNICNSNPPLGSGQTYPTTLQSDNGVEFNNATLVAWAGLHNVNHIFTQSYTPQSNGKTERKNREIRKKIKAGYLRNNNKAWTQFLQDYVANINAQVSSRSQRMRPMSSNQLWQPGHPPFPGPLGPVNNASLTPRRAAIINRQFLEQRAARWTHGALPTFQVGDNVRVDMFSLSTAYRRLVKQHEQNKLAVNWSPVVSTVIQVFPRFGQRRRELYAITVGTINGLPPALGILGPAYQKANGTVWLFAGNQLTKAGDRVHLNPKTIPRADFINSTN